MIDGAGAEDGMFEKTDADIMMNNREVSRLETLSPMEKMKKNIVVRDRKI